ncbi:hypothetical protein A6U87_15610 [Rhizobium sp. AC44/96]|nr:hypothetical protein A6U87_15610 [Rhizobium sp. AC44/96]
MRWKLFAVLMAAWYIWTVFADFGGVPRSQFRMVGDACLGLFATIGVLLYAFELQLFSGQFWSWFSRLYLAWVCVWLAFYVVRVTVFFHANMDAPSVGRAILLTACLVALLARVYSLQWVALTRHARGEKLG